MQGGRCWETVGVVRGEGGGGAGRMWGGAGRMWGGAGRMWGGAGWLGGPRQRDEKTRSATTGW
ncbi:hypothetical protein ACQ86N_46275 [Puia sp. P3]|uniref:hypothetical protein n=1 Tax=Puia sp. P3 TaxID=3423952 RepID=UPI003D67ECF5